MSDSAPKDRVGGAAEGGGGGIGPRGGVSAVDGQVDSVDACDIRQQTSSSSVFKRWPPSDSPIFFSACTPLMRGIGDVRNAPNESGGMKTEGLDRLDAETGTSVLCSSTDLSCVDEEDRWGSSTRDVSDCLLAFGIVAPCGQGVVISDNDACERGDNVNNDDNPGGRGVDVSDAGEAGLARAETPLLVTGGGFAVCGRGRVPPSVEHEEFSLGVDNCESKEGRPGEARADEDTDFKVDL